MLTYAQVVNYKSESEKQNNLSKSDSLPNVFTRIPCETAKCYSMLMLFDVQMYMYTPFTIERSTYHFFLLFTTIAKECLFCTKGKVKCDTPCVTDDPVWKPL